MKNKSEKVPAIFFISLFFLLLSPFNTSLATDEVDRLMNELGRPDWQSALLSPAAFSAYKDDRSFETLVSLISNKGIDWRIRVRAILLLGGTENPKGVPLLTQTLTDPIINNDCPAIKWNTATALGNFRGDAMVVDTLIYTLRFEDNIVVREAVIDSLGKIGSARAVPSLLPLLNDRSFAIKISAIKALGKIGDPSSAFYLKRVSDNDSDPYIKSEALAVLKKIAS